MIGDVDIWVLALNVELPGVPGVGVRVAEWSKAPDSSSGPHMWAWVQIPLLTMLFCVMWEKQMQALKMSLYVGVGSNPTSDNAFFCWV